MAENRIELKVTGMTCGGCVAAVERALKGVTGVEEVSVDRDKGAASVRIGSGDTGPDELILAVRTAGYDAQLISQ